MDEQILQGTTSKRILIFIQDARAVDGSGLTGLTNATTSLTCYYAREDDGNAAGTVVSLQSATRGSFTSSGFVEKDATNMPGWYEFDPPNAALVSGAQWVVFHFQGAANMVPCPVRIQLVAYNPNDGVRLGLTALPNAAAAASGGLLINGANTGTVTLAALTVTGATTLTGNVALAAGLTITQSTTNGAGLSITGNGTGQGIISTGGATGPGAKFVGGGTSGDGIDIATTSGDGLSITPTAGSALVLTANGTSKHGAVITGGTGGTSDGLKAVAGTGGVPIRGDLTSNITGNLSGSVGSVTSGVTVTTNSDKTGYALSSNGVQAIWDALTSALTTVGSVGKWILDKLDVVVSTRLATLGYTTPPTVTENADGLLKRDMSAVSGEASRSPLNALRALRNKVSIASTTLTVTKEDDTSSAWTAAITTDASQDPISAIDPT